MSAFFVFPDKETSTRSVTTPYHRDFRRTVKLGPVPQFSNFRLHNQLAHHATHGHSSQKKSSHSSKPLLHLPNQPHQSQPCVQPSLSLPSSSPPRVDLPEWPDSRVPYTCLRFCASHRVWGMSCRDLLSCRGRMCRNLPRKPRLGVGRSDMLVLGVSCC